MMQNVAYIYALCDPGTDSVRYVGKFVNPIQRLKAHLLDNSNIRKARWINALKTCGQSPRVLILEAVDVSIWIEAERFWIAYLRRKGHDLTNHTDGGEGLSNPTQDTREKMSVQQRQRFQSEEYRAKLFTLERAKNISASLSGKPKSPQHVAKLPQNQKGFKQRPEVVAKVAQASRGRKHTPQTIAKMREVHRGNQHGLGNRSRYGQTQSAEERAKKSASQKGVPKTEAHKEKIRLAALNRWAKYRERINEHLLEKRPVPQDD